MRGKKKKIEKKVVYLCIKSFLYSVACTEFEADYVLYNIDFLPWGCH
jgi:hypothetical protein